MSFLRGLAVSENNGKEVVGRWKLGRGLYHVLVSNSRAEVENSP